MKLFMYLGSLPDCLFSDEIYTKIEIDQSQIDMQIPVISLEVVKCTCPLVTVEWKESDRTMHMNYNLF